MKNVAPMNPAPVSSRHPNALLNRLRRQLLLGFVALTVISLFGFSVLLLQLETSARQRETNSALLGRASRAAVQVYGTATNAHTEAVADDTVSEPPNGIVIFAGTTLTTIFQRGNLDPNDLRTLAARAMKDSAEKGSTGVVTTRGHTLRAAAMPWYGDNGQIAGAVVVTGANPHLSNSPLLIPLVVGSVALVLLLSAAGWLVVRRGIAPAQLAVAERERFLSMAAHELRTPLARLRAGTESLQHSEPLTPPQATALLGLVTMVDAASHVVNNLLLASRIDQSMVSTRHEPVRLSQLAADAEHLDPRVIVDIAEPVTVTGDAHLLRHAIANLVDNALRHGAPDPALAVVMVSVFGRDGVTVLRVRDNGPGFAPGADVIKPYVASPAGGNGLGLALVAWIADAHRATLTVGSGPADDPGGIVDLSFP